MSSWWTIARPTPTVRGFLEAKEVIAADFDQAFMARLEPNGRTFIAIATRGHRDDMRILRRAVQPPRGYVGNDWLPQKDNHDL